jgi:hypothetical protein
MGKQRRELWAHSSKKIGKSGRMKVEVSSAFSTYDSRRNACRFLDGQPEGERLFGRTRHRWNDSIKRLVDLR